MEPAADVDAMVADAVRTIRDRFGADGLRDLVALASEEIRSSELAVADLGELLGLRRNWTSGWAQRTPRRGCLHRAGARGRQRRIGPQSGCAQTLQKLAGPARDVVRHDVLP